MTLERDVSGVACYQCEKCGDFIPIPWATSRKDDYER